MASDRQIEANRKNAQKCTGPRTEKGRAISSQNALKTGLDAKSEVLRFESRQDYEALIAAFYDRYHPTVPEDRTLVDMLIRSEWFLRRYTAIDTALWEHDFYQKNETSLGAAFLRNEKALERVGRRISWAQRNYQQALRQLLAIRAQREAEPESEEPEEVTEPAPEVPENNAETTPHSNESVSFLPLEENQPKTTENTPQADPNPEENPPTAA